MTDSVNKFLLVGSLIILFSVLLSKSSDKFGLPILLIFIFTGMMVGSEGIGGVQFENYELTQTISVFAMCLIIFAGGVATDFTTIQKNLYRGISLSSLGIILTTVVVGLFVKLITSFSYLESFLFGAILSATDAAAVFSAFKDKTRVVSKKVSSLLEFESGSNDPMAYFLVIILLGFLKGEQKDVGDIVLHTFLNPVVGLVVGRVMAKAFVSLNNVINLAHQGMYPALTFSFIFLSYSAAVELDGNGFLSVYVFSLYISSKKILHKNLLYSFYDGFSWLAQIGLFVLLGLLVFPSHLVGVAGKGIVISVFLIMIARPIAIFICLSFSQFTFKEKVFISWAGLKGATPIVFASMSAVQLGHRADLIFDLVFFVVVLSAIIQGSSLKWLAQKLGLMEAGVEESSFPINFDEFEKTRNGIREIRIEAGYNAVGKRVVDLQLPNGCLVLFVKREGSFIVPNGASTFEVGDKLLFVTKEKEEVEQALACFSIGRPTEKEVSV